MPGSWEGRAGGNDVSGTLENCQECGRKRHYIRRTSRGFDSRTQSWYRSRRKACSSCGTVISTIEIPLSTYSGLVKMFSAINRASQWPPPWAPGYGHEPGDRQ